jgi:hypothetical protein
VSFHGSPPAIALGVAQPDLFADDAPAVDERFSTAHRIALDEKSWVEHVPGWLTARYQATRDT